MFKKCRIELLPQSLFQTYPKCVSRHTWITQLIKNISGEKKTYGRSKSGGGVRWGMIMITDSMGFFYAFHLQEIKLHFWGRQSGFQVPENLKQSSFFYIVVHLSVLVSKSVTEEKGTENWLQVGTKCLQKMSALNTLYIMSNQCHYWVKIYSFIKQQLWLLLHWIICLELNTHTNVYFALRPVVVFQIEERWTREGIFWHGVTFNCIHWKAYNTLQACASNVKSEL